VPYAAKRPWITIALWLLVIALAVPQLSQVTAHLSSGGFSAPHSQSQAADATVSRLRTPPSAPTVLVRGLSLRQVTRLANETRVAPTALHQSGARQVVVVPGASLAAMRAFVIRARQAGARVTSLNATTLGQAVSQEAIAAFTSSTAVAVPALLLLLLLVFGAVVPAMLPLVTAGVGTVVTLAAVSVVERYVPLSVYLLQIVSFLALGVGVDYALFVSTRFRAQLEADRSVDEAVTLAMRTSGRSVLFSGLAVSLALAALVLGGTAYWEGMALGGALAVASVLLVTHTLLPALLRLVGGRVSTGRIHFAMPDWRLWRVLAHWATSSPRWALGLGLLVLVIPALAAPALKADIPANVSAMLPAANPLARAQAVVNRVQGQGSQAPFVVVLSLPTPVTDPETWTLVGQATGELKALPDVASVSSPTGLAAPSLLAASARSPKSPLGAFVSGPRRVDLFVTATSGPDSAQSVALLGRIHARLSHLRGVSVSVGGPVAVMQALNVYLGGRLPFMAAAVVLVALVVLWLATGSLLQAAVGVGLNALVTLATAGILVTVIQRGALGVVPEPLNLAVAPLVFVMLFGLSMDYQVILLHRIQERLGQGEGARQAAAHAVGTTGGMITGAGLIMVAVVGALLVSPFEVLQTLAIGLVSAVILDTMVVRTFVVPAVITLLDRHAFWPRVNHPLLPLLREE